MMKGKVEPFVVPIVVQVMPIVVQVGKHTIEVPQITSPHERQLKEQRQEVKKEHDTRFPKGEEHLHFDGDVYEDYQMETTGNPQHFQNL